MPFEWNNLQVSTKEELVPFFGSWKNLEKRIQRDKIKGYGLRRVQLGGNGRQMLIDFDSLPQHIKNGIGDPRLVNHELEPFFKPDREAVRFFANFQLPNGSYLEVEFQHSYILNARVLRAAVSYREVIERQKKGGKLTGIDAILCKAVDTFNKTLKVKHKDGHTLPGSEKQFKKVLNAFETEGYKTLVSGKLGNKNSLKVTEDTLELLESMYATDFTKPTRTEVHREYLQFLNGHLDVVSNETGLVYNPADFKAISDSTVLSWLDKWQSRIATHTIRGGDRQKLITNYKFSHKLRKTETPGALLSVDDRQPAFKTHNGKRIWFYNGYDLGSECFTCWVHGTTKEGIIIEFYQQLVRNYAGWGLCLPDGLEAEASLNSQHEETFLREGAMFERVRIEANNARGKFIERVYGEIRYKYEKKREGWLARPFALSESNQVGSHNVPTLAYDDIVEGCLADIETWNNTPHSVHTHLTRWEVFTQMQRPDLKPINYPAILYYLGYKTETSCNAGEILFRRTQYILAENGTYVFGETLINLLKQVEGNKVCIYWLDDNAGGVLKALVYMGSLLICEALPKPSYGRPGIEQTPEDAPNREILIKYGNTIDAYCKRYKKTIERVTKIDNTPPREKKFIMAGLKQPKVYDMNTPAEILTEKTEDDLTPQKSYVRTLKQDFLNQ